MTVATTTSAVRGSVCRQLPLLAAALAVVAVALLGSAPLGWRAGWWHFRFSLLTLLPWAGYFGIAAVVVSVLALLLGRSRIPSWGAVVAVLAFVAGGGVVYVPWHYNTVRHTVPAINDITTDIDNPPAFVALASAHAAEGGNPVAYPGAKFADQQKQAYPDIAPLILSLPPAAAFNKALDTARQMGWTIVKADDAAGRIEASEKSRWFGFTDDIVIRIAAAGSGSRVDVRSASRLGRGDFGVNATRIRSYMGELRTAAGGQS